MHKILLKTLQILGLIALTILYSSFSYAAFTCSKDIGGANDENGQSDLTQLCIDESNLPTSYDVQLSWDETGLPGNNTGDACILFDTDTPGDGNINFALCLSIGGNPAALVSGPSLYSCNNATPDRCSGPTALTPVAGSQTSCTVTQEATDPFDATVPNGPGDDYPDDTVAECTIDIRDIPPGAAQVNAASFNSSSPNSNPVDLLAVVGGGFITIIKNATPDDGTAFNFTITDSIGGSNSVTINGSDSIVTSVAPGTYSISEAVPTGWSLTSASCDDGSSTPGNPVTGIVVGISETVVCTVTNSNLTADLSITKDDGSLTYTPGGTGTYTIVVRNNGPDNVTGAAIADNLPNGVTLSAPWTCSATAGSSCSAASGGSIGGNAVSLTADILNGGVVTVNVPVQFSANMSDY